MPKYFIKDITVGTTKIKTIISDYERTFLQSRWYRGSNPGTGATNFTGFGIYLLSENTHLFTELCNYRYKSERNTFLLHSKGIYLHLQVCGIMLIVLEIFSIEYKKKLLTGLW